MAASPVIELRPAGLYCAAGDFYVDPWRPVERAVITHGHSDHARSGHTHYLAAEAGIHVLRQRLGDVSLQTLAYGERLRIGAATISLHPAGHVLGSAQVRVEAAQGVWVLSGDYKLQGDRTCMAFEPVRCDTFVTESTFGLPIYRWEETAQVVADMLTWWRANAELGRASVVFAYALGKAQRILAEIAAQADVTSIGPIVCHGAVEALNRAYRASGVVLPETKSAMDVSQADLRRALVIAPPSAQGAPWLKRFGEYADGFASGWMRIRGTRRRRAVDRGFVLSDHADWPGLQSAIAATGARQVYVTHGYVEPLMQWLTEQGLDARRFETPFGEEEEAGVSVTPEEGTDASAPVDGSGA